MSILDEAPTWPTLYLLTKPCKRHAFVIVDTIDKLLAQTFMNWWCRTLSVGVPDWRLAKTNPWGQEASWMVIFSSLFTAFSYSQVLKLSELCAGTQLPFLMNFTIWILGDQFGQVLSDLTVRNPIYSSIITRAHSTLASLCCILFLFS